MNLKTGCKITISSKFTAVSIHFCSLFRTECVVGKVELQGKYCNSGKHHARYEAMRVIMISLFI